MRDEYAVFLHQRLLVLVRVDAVCHDARIFAAEIDELWAEREESELTKRLLEENGLPNLAQIFTQRRYVREDNLSISNSYFALLKEKGFFNN